MQTSSSTSLRQKANFSKGLERMIEDATILRLRHGIVLCYLQGDFSFVVEFRAYVRRPYWGDAARSECGYFAHSSTASGHQRGLIRLAVGRLHPKRRAMSAKPYTYRLSSFEEEAFVASPPVDMLPCCARKSNSSPVICHTGLPINSFIVIIPCVLKLITHPCA